MKPPAFGNSPNNEMIGSRWFFVRAGLGNLLPVEIDNKTVGHTSFVRRAIIQRDARHER